EVRNFLEGGAREVSPHFVPMMMPNAAAGLIAMRLGVHGPGFSVSSACATGAHALGEAKRMIERGDADVVVAGGAESALCGTSRAAFARMGATSREGVSRPFDARRDGFVMGEGAGVLVLERADHARARGARLYGVLAGYGASNDAFHITQPDEEGRGAVRAMRAALADAGAQPADVGHVNAHGTSTPFNDRIEVAALRDVFAGDPPPTTATKSAIGHLLGAAGAVEAVVAGSGTVDGAPVFCWAQDGRFRGGSLGTAGGDTIARVLALAGRAGAPVVGFPESGGARVQEGVAALSAYAAIFRAQANAHVPVVSVVSGVCAGGAAYACALGDLTIAAGPGARLFLTGPGVVREVTREEVDPLD